jgi:hypothetical protein
VLETTKGKKEYMKLGSHVSRPPFHLPTHTPQSLQRERSEQERQGKRVEKEGGGECSQVRITDDTLSKAEGHKPSKRLSGLRKLMNNGRQQPPAPSGVHNMWKSQYLQARSIIPLLSWLGSFQIP